MAPRTSAIAPKSASSPLVEPVRTSPAVTVNGIDWLRVDPFGADPSTSMVCAPAVAFDGIVTAAVTTPDEFALTVASTTGLEWKMICALEPGA